MPFYLRPEAHDWFSNLQKSKKPGRGFTLDFDMYYTCLIAGIAAGKRAKLPDDPKLDLSDFPGEYRQNGKLIVAMFLARECKVRGVRLDDRKRLHDTIRDLVSPDSSPWLSPAGMRLMNEYAAGGLDVLIDSSRGQKPQHLEAFLPKFLAQIDQLLNPS
ncbi:MAG: hypothetical protein AAF797_08490 [Planctomycetota bacterium]